MGMLMEQSTGVAFTHVPFQGGAPANTALVGSHIGYKFDVVSETARSCTVSARCASSP